MGLFDLGCGFVSLDAGFFDLVVFFVMSISLVVFDVGFAFGFVSFTVPFFFFFKVSLVDMGLCQW